MTLLLAAVGATVTALLELTVGPYLRIGDAQPHLVLVVGIVVTVAIGLEAGLVWAFVGGLVLDVLAQRPLGSTAFALLLCMGATAVLGRLFVHLRPIVPILATALLSLLYSMILYVALNALQTPIPVADPLAILVPGAVYDIVLAAVIGPLAISIHDRRAADAERVDW
jgi:rod shape-determining protein MreD